MGRPQISRKKSPSYRPITRLRMKRRIPVPLVVNLLDSANQEWLGVQRAMSGVRMEMIRSFVIMLMCHAARCSLTQILITFPTYRICTTCPAVSLLPLPYKTTPIPVSPDGKAQDQTRFDDEHSSKYDMVERVLRCAQVCAMCGGRWMRAV
jgi:hypothetical protein